MGSECANIHTTCCLKIVQHTGLGIFSFSAALLVKVCIFLDHYNAAWWDNVGEGEIHVCKLAL